MTQFTSLDMKSRREFLFTAASSSMLLAACGQEGGSNSGLVSKWNETALDAVRNGTLAPPMVARALAMVYTAMFDAWAPYDRKAVATLFGGPQRLASSSEAKEKAMSYAAYEVLKDVYPEQLAKFDAAMNALGFPPAAALATNDAGQIGRDAAKRLLDYRHADGSNQMGNLAAGAYADYTGYQSANTVDVLNDPNRWQALKFSNGKAPGFIAPHWGEVKPFSLATGHDLRPSLSLPSFGTKAYKDQADVVLNYTANLSDTQKAIAEYWANGPKSETPPGVWHKIAQYVAQRGRFDLDEEIKMFFMLSNAVMDAGITCWDCKRTYDSMRPITAIRALYKGQQVPGLVSADVGIGLMHGEAWMPYQPTSFITPPFAEFVSGHSTFSAASAYILRRYSGGDSFGDSTSFAPGSLLHQKRVPVQTVTLQWETFTAAAQEAGLSRLYGGIHFEAGNAYGQSLGEKVGEAVFNRAQYYINGVRP